MLNSPPKIELQPREQILQEIRSQPKLRPVRERKIGRGGQSSINVFVEIKLLMLLMQLMNEVV